jgi:hypothetical protein
MGAVWRGTDPPKIGRCPAGAQKGPVQPTLCQHVLQRLLQFQHWSTITYNMSTCGAEDISFYITGLVLPKICEHVLQRLLNFSAIVSYYLHYINKCCSGYSILQHWPLITDTMSAGCVAITSFFSTGLLIPTLCQLVLQGLLHFSGLLSYYLHYDNMCCSCFLIFQHGSRISYTMSTCAAAVISFFRTGLVLPSLFQHEL